jgi:mono/diheme cytochrome c family protein
MKISSVSIAFVMAAISVSAADKVDFAKQIQPILEKNCVQCHGAEKQKGGLRLDTKEGALKGGKDATAIVPKDIPKSDLIRRVTLPSDDDDVMPPKGDLLTKAQADLLRDWITQGAVWPDGLVLKSGSGESKTETAKLPDYKPGAAELKAIAGFEAAGIGVRPIAQNMNWREASFRSMGTNATDATIAPLKDILGLIDLNLAGTKITDNGLASIKGLTNLVRLHLEHTQITDTGLANLKNLSHLEYLNLFDTKITDAGLENLKGMTHLKNLHVWQTKVTEAAAKNLEKSIPDLDVDRGWDASTVAKKEPEPEKKTAAK